MFGKMNNLFRRAYLFEEVGNYDLVFFRVVPIAIGMLNSLEEVELMVRGCKFIHPDAFGGGDELVGIAMDEADWYGVAF